MKIWHIMPYDTIPGENWRPGRAINMCKVLSDNGYEVIWWTSNYSHFFKRFRSKSWKTIKVSDNFTINLIPVIGYNKHIGIRRLLFHITFSYRFYKKARTLEPPDYIIFATPAPFADYLTTRLAKETGARLIVDIRDLWPELFYAIFPHNFQFILKTLFSPFKLLRDYSLKNAYYITAVTKTYLQHAKKITTKQKIIKGYKTIYFGVNLRNFQFKNKDTNFNLSLKKNKDDIWIIYAGTLGVMYDLSTMLETFRLLEKENKNCKLLIAGNGPLKEYVTTTIKEKKLRNVNYLGTLSINELVKYYIQSDIGLCAYKKNSTVVMPARVYDYFAAGLVIINSLSGELEDILITNSIGLQYESENIQSLYKCIDFLSRNVNMLNEMKAKSLSLSRRFSMKYQYSHFIQIIEEN